jgi:hypothetical protein
MLLGAHIPMYFNRYNNSGATAERGIGIALGHAHAHSSSKRAFNFLTPLP